jgi:hypothetical protein
LFASRCGVANFLLDFAKRLGDIRLMEDDKTDKSQSVLDSQSVAIAIPSGQPKQDKISYQFRALVRPFRCYFGDFLERFSYSFYCL